MIEKRKRCHCPVKDLVTFTYLPLPALSWSCHVFIPASGGTDPQVPRRSLPGHTRAELSKALVNRNLWKYVTCCTKSAPGLSQCLCVTPDRMMILWSSLYKGLTPLSQGNGCPRAKALGQWGLAPCLQHLWCCISSFSENRGKDGEERRQDKRDWVWYGPAVTSNPGSVQSGNCHWCNTHP